jgi:hypothetical protein
MFQFASFDEV